MIMEEKGIFKADLYLASILENHILTKGKTTHGKVEVMSNTNKYYYIQHK